MEVKYIYGVHCGNKDCYACGTQRYNCNELNRLDDEEDKNWLIKELYTK